MHACGHDGHMTILLAAAQVLAAMKSRLRGNVILVFQPAEEGLGGAREIIKAGVLAEVSAIFGLHMYPYNDLGVVGVKEGALMAASDRFEVAVIGKGECVVHVLPLYACVVAVSSVTCALLRTCCGDAFLVGVDRMLKWCLSLQVAMALPRRVRLMPSSRPPSSSCSYKQCVLPTDPCAAPSVLQFA